MPNDSLPYVVIVTRKDTDKIVGGFPSYREASAYKDLLIKCRVACDKINIVNTTPQLMMDI